MKVVGLLEAGGRLIAAAALALTTLSLQPAMAQQGPSGEGERPSDAEQDSAAIRQQLVFALSAYHGGPTQAQLAALGSPEQVASVLRDIARDAAARPSMRQRAVGSLGHFADAHTVDFLERVVDSPSTLEVRRSRDARMLHRRAVSSFARIRGEQAVDKLAAFAARGDLQLRLTAVAALGRFGGKAGRARLRELRAEIEQPLLLRTMNKYVEHPSKD